MSIRKRRTETFRLIGTSVLLFVHLTFAKAQEFPHDTDKYPFINYSENFLKFPGDSTYFDPFFQRMDEIIFEGEGQIDVIHMGGSHIQAGVFSAQMRTHLQSIQPSLDSYRGYLFPFRVAKTNNPSNYRVNYSGSWDYCKNTEKKKACNLGLSGMSVTTWGENSYIKIRFNEDFPKSTFSGVKIFCETDSTHFTPVVNDGAEYEVSKTENYYHFTFKEEQDSLMLRLAKDSSYQKSFTLYGIKFENEYPGFAYHAIGVNGASVPSYLRCDLLDEHSDDIQPELAIFSIGINDAYGTRFSKSQFKANYRQLIHRIKEGSPEVRIIFTTNNDSYYRRRYPNRNGILVQEAMMELAEEFDAAVWDLFAIMGGLGSVKTWESYGLAKSDKIHFTRAGYELVGDMFFSALIKSYENHLKTDQ